MAGPATTQRGFTLIEISMVLVIIGLIVGAIMVGQSDDSQHATAICHGGVSDLRRRHAELQQKYNALPGDMANATSYWGSAGGTGKDTDSTCANAIVSAGSTATCNGNGNGTIGDSDASNWAEMERYWQHLANGGLIPGGPYLTQTLAYGTFASGVNAGPSKLGNVVWSSTTALPADAKLLR